MSCRFGLTLILLFALCTCNAQTQFSTKSKKAIGFFEEGQQLIINRDFKGAISKFLEAIKTDPDFFEAGFLLADAYKEAGENQKAIEVYRKLLPGKPNALPWGWYNYGRVLFEECQYLEATPAFSKYLELKGIPNELRRDAEKKLLDCSFAQEALKHPVPFVPINLGDSINSSLSEYWPSLSADGTTLSFTRLVPKNPDKPYIQGNLQEDIYFSSKNQKYWLPARNFGSPLNTSGNEGAQSISADGKTMYFTACNRDAGLGMCDIYVSYLTPEGWSTPENLGSPVNSKSSEKQPSISPDGRTLYFASNRAGTKGGLDIWSSVKDDQGIWQDPVNLGDSINTTWDEQSPFIHEDNRTLYFSSAGWPGMGGFDMYLSSLSPTGKWTRARNLGYPINTCRDEDGLIVNTRGDMAIYASGRSKERGMDLFSFELYKDIRPLSSSYLKGKVYDVKTGKPLGAVCQLIDLNSGQLINNATSNTFTGELLVTLPSDKDYALNVSKNGYMFFSENFNLKGIFEAGNPYLMDIPLSPVKVGEKVILNNIFFETDSWKLKEASEIEIRKLIDFLNNNPGISIEVSGHTDNTGSAEHNKQLSENRAGAVCDYLLDHGIQSDRIIRHGYGASMPVADNSSAEGRAKNRRTEFKVTGKK